MRDIKKLTDRDYIRCRTQEQWDYISKLIGKEWDTARWKEYGDKSVIYAHYKTYASSQVAKEFSGIGYEAAEFMPFETKTDAKPVKFEDLFTPTDTVEAALPAPAKFKAGDYVRKKDDLGAGKVYQIACPTFLGYLAVCGRLFSESDLIPAYKVDPPTIGCRDYKIEKIENPVLTSDIGQVKSSVEQKDEQLRAAKINQSESLLPMDNTKEKKMLKTFIMSSLNWGLFQPLKKTMNVAAMPLPYLVCYSLVAAGILGVMYPKQVTNTVSQYMPRLTWEQQSVETATPEAAPQASGEVSE